MADPSPLAGLLDRAGHVFTLAWQLGRAFEEEHSRQRSRGRVDPTGWERHQPAVERYFAAVLELRAEMQTPPDGFASVAKPLMEAARVAKQIRDTRKTGDGITFALFLDFWPHLNSVAAEGRRVLQEIATARRSEDPFAFVDQPAANNAPEIDTTPTLPKPPAGLIAEAARAIPELLANVSPKHDGAIELVAAHLAKQLQDAKHSLAAAHWAIHESVRAGRLTTGRVVVHLPTVIGSGSRGLPERYFGTHARAPSPVLDMPSTGTKPIPEGKPAPFDCFKVVATPALWEWWRSLEAAPRAVNDLADTPNEQEEPAPVGAPTSTPAQSAKRSTERGEGRAKLVAALTKHHQYAEGGCLNLDPIGNNELAKAAGVAASTASAFFDKEFAGHTQYKVLSRDSGDLAAALKVLNGEYSPCDLYGRRPPDEDDREDE